MTKPSPETIHTIYERLKAESVNWYKTSMHPYIGEPFKALMTAMLSTQTREEQTAAASEALFALADSPEKVLAVGADAVREAIRPASFYNNKTNYIMDISRILIEQHNGLVPDSLEALMALPGIGWKVAVLVLYIAFGSDEHITVDTHVDRVSKRLGIIPPDVKGTKKIGLALEAALPREYYGAWNELLVLFGREVCKARNPLCDTCFLRDICPRVGL